MRRGVLAPVLDVLLPFTAGIHFALLQTGYFLLLEAHLSSQSLSYFVALFFWLTGLLLGLYLRDDRWFGPLLGAGVVGYYLTFALTRWIPFHPGLYPAAALSAVISGLLPGFFFRFAARRWAANVARPLFHENNGFVLGLFLALRGAIHFGGRLVALGPLASGLLVVVALVGFRLIRRGTTPRPA